MAIEPTTGKIMQDPMDEQYFDEKKNLALASIRDAVSRAEEARCLIENISYSTPLLVNAAQIHELLDLSVRGLISTRRNFEKTRWVFANSGLEFKEWLNKNGYSELDNS